MGRENGSWRVFQNSRNIREQKKACDRYGAISLDHIDWTEYQPWMWTMWSSTADGEGQVSSEATGEVDTKDTLENLETLRGRT
ncbi:hypothetical protein BTVI_18458 [Pitangus sulphuratus]|nr:hypothetical protein BTVI_18458 [Pitangus sulphuratus]